MINLKDYGYQGDPAAVPEGLLPARIMEARRERYKAVCAFGEVSAVVLGALLHRAKDSGDYPVVGDFVWLRHNETGDCGIAEILPRRTKFSRTDFSGHAVGYVKTIREQVVAVNFDSVFILSSLNQDFNLNRIARYVTQARQSGGVPVVALTKADLCEDWRAQAKSVRDLAADVDVIPLSSHTGLGLDRLAPYLGPGKTAVFLGMSGVGKSSLLNALLGEERMAVKDIRADDARGRHTTTHRQLVRLPTGAMIIDTPGMRELGLWDGAAGIQASYADIEELIAGCRFSDCKHQTEPGCAVLAALKDGSVPKARWKGYLAQKREAEFVARRVKKAAKRR